MTKPLLPYQRKTGFWLNVEKQQFGCWLWKGAISRSGYGLCSFRGRTMGAHRAAWTMEHGAIPVGLLVLHKCDVRNCVRPDHLFTGTYQDNMRDMYAKGRGPIGAKNGANTKPHRRAFGDRNGSRLHPESRPRGKDHWAHKHPEMVRGEKNPNSKLTDSQVKRIRNLYSAGHTQVALAMKFGVTQVHISRLVRGVQR